jgi:hypothetical protein
MIFKQDRDRKNFSNLSNSVCKDKSLQFLRQGWGFDQIQIYISVCTEQYRTGKSSPTMQYSLKPMLIYSISDSWLEELTGGARCGKCSDGEGDSSLAPTQKVLVKVVKINCNNIEKAPRTIVSCTVL